MKLERIKKIDLRKTWKHEASDFTNWLAEKQDILEEINETDERVTKWIDEFEEKLEFAKLIRVRFAEATPEKKKEILNDLGSNLLLKDKKVNIVLPEYRNLLERLKNEASKTIRKFEPLKTFVKQEDYDEIYSSNPVMLRGQDSNL